MDSTELLTYLCAGLAGFVLLVIFILIFRSKEKSTPFKFDIGGQGPRASGGQEISPIKSYSSRLKVLAAASTGIIGVLIGRLWYMDIAKSDEYTKKAEENRTRTVTTPAPRGRILDRNGAELVSNRPSLTIASEKDVYTDDIEVTLLANLLGMPKIAVKRKIQDETVTAQSLRVVAQDVSRRTVAYIDEHSHVFIGISVQERTQRTYPNGKLASHVLGYTGNITEEQLKANSEQNDEAISYERGDITGQSGIEAMYESVLQGVRGEQKVYVDASGNVTGYSDSVPASMGSDVTLTLDSGIQKACEDGLAHAIAEAKKHDNKATGGACITLDPKTGDILGMASYPEYTPALFIGGISNDDWENLSKEEAQNPLLNRAIAGMYPPASTVKPLSTFAALDSGIAAPDSTYECTGFWTGFGEAYGKYCSNKNGHGTIGLSGAITYSCNTVFYEIAKGFFQKDSKGEDLQNKFKQWGLESKTGIDLPGEALGRVPTPKWKWDWWEGYDDGDRAWSGGDFTNIVIGQGDMLATPIQMACAYAGIANGGNVLRPHLMKNVSSENTAGSVIEYKDENYLTISEDSSYFDIVHSGLKGVIYEEDYDLSTHFNNLDVTVAGKSGTGQVAGKNPTSWFIVYAPYDDPQYVVATTIEEGGYGANGAMYACRDVLGYIYSQPDTSTAVADVQDV